MLNKVLENAKKKEKEYLRELFHLLSIPSVSTLPEHHQDIHKAASWLAEHMEEVGLENIQIFETKGHPIICGDWMHAKNMATVLIYGHYDVQPPDPLDEWLSNPFGPQVRNNNIYARGANDNKGQLFIHLKSVDSFMETVGKLPVNIKFILEGEEECGSDNLEDFITKNKKFLEADFALVSDTPSAAVDQPTLIYGLRGILYTEITIQTAEHDLHSGEYGGAVENPVHVLSKIIARLHDKNRRVTIPGFYKDVADSTGEERKMFKKIGDAQKLREHSGATRLVSEKGFTPSEAKRIRPTLEVNGIWGGFTAEGVKTVLPYKASAKISMRLVPNQDPGKIEKDFEAYLRRLTPKTAKLSFKSYHSSNSVVVEREGKAMKAAVAALRETFGREPLLDREGGSIPVVETFSRVLGIQTVLMGFGLPDDNLHAPNEKFSLEMFRKGIETSIRFLSGIGSTN